MSIVVALSVDFRLGVFAHATLRQSPVKSRSLPARKLASLTTTLDTRLGLRGVCATPLPKIKRGWLLIVLSLSEVIGGSVEILLLTN